MIYEDLYPDRDDLREAVADRFWSKVDVGSRDECWPWQASVQKPKKRAPGGYGRFGIGNTTPAGVINAHRMAFLLTYGEVPDDLSVCHSCDNPPCCNPRHLWLGTRIDNNLDRDQKGRARSGDSRADNNPNAKLGAYHVAYIRRRLRDGEYIADLAEELGVSRSAVTGAALGKTWSSLVISEREEQPLDFIPRDGRQRPRSTLARKKVSEMGGLPSKRPAWITHLGWESMRLHVEEEMSIPAIARRLGGSPDMHHERIKRAITALQSGEREKVVLPRRAARSVPVKKSKRSSSRKGRAVEVREERERGYTSLASIYPDPRQREAFVHRFWSRVACGNTNECWPWKAGSYSHGKAGIEYGRCSIGGGRVMTAHRVAYLVSNGGLPPELMVGHSCDTSLCCNPRHLEARSGKKNAEHREARARRNKRRSETRNSGTPVSDDGEAGERGRLREEATLASGDDGGRSAI